MRPRRFGVRESLRHPILGLSDGILAALTLAAGRLLEEGAPLGLSLAVRLAAASFASGAFVFFVSHYGELRLSLIRAERQLNLTTHGKLAASHLGHKVLWESIRAAATSSLFCFAGALVPLLAGVFVSRPTWIPLAVALAALGLLGAGIARVIRGRTVRWVLGLLTAGVVLTAVGAVLRIV